MKTQNPWMGRARGSAGNMTSSKVYDKNVMRAKAFEVNNPKTAAQTNERNFFADAQKVCQTVSEEQLRSLFGVKPKSKSRRNALLSQLLVAVSINNGVKEFDFSKLYAIGNGQKINVPIAEITNEEADFETALGQIFLDQGMENDTSLIFVIFDTDNNQIKLVNSGDTVEDYDGSSIVDTSPFNVSNGYIYATCETNGKNVAGLDFGTFTLKTRAV